MLKNFASASWPSGNILISALSTAHWRSGENDCERVLLLKDDSLNMNCDSWCNSVVATVHYELWLCRLIVWLLITFAVTVFSVFWLLQSHAAVVKRYNAFCVKLLQTVTPNKITSASQHFLYVLVNIFTFNELWKVTFCHKTRRVCNVRRCTATKLVR